MVFLALQVEALVKATPVLVVGGGLLALVDMVLVELAVVALSLFVTQDKIVYN
jgi:hypothetical protein